ncbi:MAG: histidine phosphatase family protein [Acetobacteraceae bacterium]
MRTVFFITHPDVALDPAVPITEWPLSPRGRQRMEAASMRQWLAGVGAIWCSTERKAIDGAAILAGGLGVPWSELASLGENDRASTGYLPKAEFEMVADAFFARPLESVRGWERAVDAQRRIVGAIDTVLNRSHAAGDIAIVSHGGVAALLLCRLRGCEISRDHDQPSGNGGHIYAFDAVTRELQYGWRSLELGGAA